MNEEKIYSGEVSFDQFWQSVISFNVKLFTLKLIFLSTVTAYANHFKLSGLWMFSSDFVE